MSSLKELTWDAHKRAERTDIMRLLITNKISDCLYCDLVYTKYLIYSSIEGVLQFRTPCLKRAQAALNDWQQMGCSLPRCFTSLDSYLAYMRTLSSHQLWSHAYVHYLAPLYGGQIIRKQIQDRFPTSMYQFDDPEAAIAEVRQCLTVDMAPEANRAFDMTTAYLTDLYLQHQGPHDQLCAPDSTNS